jgi:hypothetical protein
MPWSKPRVGTAYNVNIGLKGGAAYDLRCSFCNKHQDEVQKLIAGPSVFICDDCVGVCNEILSGNPFDVPPADQRKHPALDALEGKGDGQSEPDSCSICRTAIDPDLALALPERGVLCEHCVAEIEDALAGRFGSK